MEWDGMNCLKGKERDGMGWDGMGMSFFISLLNHTLTLLTCLFGVVLGFVLFFFLLLPICLPTYDGRSVGVGVGNVTLCGGYCTLCPSVRYLFYVSRQSLGLDGRDVVSFIPN